MDFRIHGPSSSVLRCRQKKQSDHDLLVLAYLAPRLPTSKRKKGHSHPRRQLAPGPQEQLGDRGLVKLCLGPPILDKSLDEIDSDPDFCHGLLKEWLYLDAQNIARRRVGRIAIAGAASWETNKRLSEYRQVKTLYFPGGEYRLAEKALAPILTALAHNYRHDKQKAKLEALCQFLAEIEEHLDDHGREFAQGKLRVELEQP